jgi:hypothetical protein
MDFMLLADVIPEISLQHAVYRACYGNGVLCALSVMRVRPEVAIPTNFNCPTPSAGLRQLRPEIGVFSLSDTVSNRCISDVNFVTFGCLRALIVATSLAAYATA